MAPGDLPLVLDRTSEVGLTKQLARQLRAAIAQGQLEPRQRMPSTRALASALGIGRNIAFEAYEDLLAEGYLVGKDRSGTFVAQELSPQVLDLRATRPAPKPTARWLQRQVPEPQVEDAIARDQVEFRVGQTDTSTLGHSEWRRVWREVAESDLPTDYEAPAGDSLLREAVAEYLKRARGFVCSPDDVIITSGAVQGVNLIAQAVLAPGDQVGFEEPGYRLARQILQESGAQILPLPVDKDGLQLSALPSGAGAPVMVYTTPSHQFPLGVRLSIPRRLALLEWARQHDVLILEDDYDSEFRYGASPLPSLASLDTSGHVVYLGTFSKVLSPAVRVGYVVAPGALRDRLLRIKSKADFHTSWPVQRALALMITQGHLERHIRRMRKTYALKRATVNLALQPIRPYARLMGLDAGLHAHLELNPDVSAQQVIEEALRQGVIVPALAPYYLGLPDRNGLLLGYGGLTVPEIQRSAGVLCAAIAQAAGETRAP
ncbi:PLP-dependent aminotransferase family protein (plasmid) [Deinococcus taeanensis]|uniref:MocR-like pyridoxine biosynthesis transcription factor PdxR n=1 Tax=Deinococcus taeanensis TaxID=2737050 RepID=UPI001CDC4B56|nr:PLP-dependent aminotransferase family protein [Deinococcus taeanensis]UBV44487.1 PLP-dependent aminotransferase family protein [Deinococcus taeanensis]